MGQYRETSSVTSGDCSEDTKQGCEGECLPLEKGRVTPWLVLSSLAAVMCGSFQFGYQLAVLTGPSKMMHRFYNNSNYEKREVFLSETAELWLWSTTLSVLCIGGGIGAFAAGHMADAFGRKGAMWLVNIFSITGGLLMGFSYLAKSYVMVIVGRLVIGFYVGVSITIVPLYLAEISPVNLRGAIGFTQQFMISTGIVTAQALGLFVFYYESGWPILLALTAVPSVLQLIILPFCPESPRWLFIRAKEEDRAVKALKKLRGTDDIGAELIHLRSEAAKTEKSEKVGILTLFRLGNPAWKRPLIITSLINVFQQLAGINAIQFYATEIFYQAGMDETQVAYATVGAGAVQLSMTIAAVFIVDSAGRRFLLFYPYAAMAACSALLTVSLNLQETSPGWKWFSMAMIYIYLIHFAMGPGPVPYVLVPELWTQGPRSAAMSITIQTKWFANLVIGLVFPFLQDSIGAYVFLVFVVFCSVTSAFVYFYVPETKGRTFEDIAGDFGWEKIPDENQRMNPSFQEHLD